MLTPLGRRQAKAPPLVRSEMPHLEEPAYLDSSFPSLPARCTAAPSTTAPDTSSSPPTLPAQCVTSSLVNCQWIYQNVDVADCPTTTLLLPASCINSPSRTSSNLPPATTTSSSPLATTTLNLCYFAQYYCGLFDDCTGSTDCVFSPAGGDGSVSQADSFYESVSNGGAVGTVNCRYFVSADGATCYKAYQKFDITAGQGRREMVQLLTMVWKEHNFGK